MKTTKYNYVKHFASALEAMTVTFARTGKGGVNGYLRSRAIFRWSLALATVSVTSLFGMCLLPESWLQAMPVGVPFGLVGAFFLGFFGCQASATYHAVRRRMRAVRKALRAIGSTELKLTHAGPPPGADTRTIERLLELLCNVSCRAAEVSDFIQKKAASFEEHAKRPALKKLIRLTMDAGQEVERAIARQKLAGKAGLAWRSPVTWPGMDRGYWYSLDAPELSRTGGLEHHLRELAA